MRSALNYTNNIARMHCCRAIYVQIIDAKARTLYVQCRWGMIDRWNITKIIQMVASIPFLNINVIIL